MSDGKLVKDLESASSDVEILNLNPGVFYEIAVYSVGSSERLNEVGSDIVTQQTGLSMLCLSRRELTQLFTLRSSFDFKQL